MPLVVNLQRKVDIKEIDLRPFAATLATSVKEAEGSDFSVAFVSDRRMKELNQMFRGKNMTTDVLSFPNENDEFQHFDSLNDPDTSRSAQLGDIVISVEQAARQAAENGLSLELEIKQLMLHGVLHLCGYDHETDRGEMNKRELELRDKLGI
ncbi:MAG: rRNA maturation RNase YbeY [Acidobacteriota bacterium]